MDLREIMLKREALYSEFATKDGDAIRLKGHKSDMRPEFFRDVDRIIHTASYTRYMDKTQVFSFNNNDNISTRMTHVQLVSKIARTIGRALSLNEDLIEAIALAHDLGHVPFGHEGEAILNEISIKNGEGHFLHNVQSVRNLMILENKNITLQVLDGILCHNGEFINSQYYPKDKTIDEFLHEYNDCYKNPKNAKKLVPMTLEGCVVRISDTIGYIGRDIEDAIALGMFDPNTIPEEIVNSIGKTNKDIINNMITDIIKNSIGKPYIKLSDHVYTAFKDLKKFNYDNIYYKAHSKEKLELWELMFNTLFNKLKVILKSNDNTSNFFINYLDKMSDDYLNNTSDNRKIIDYIAGMTDGYFISEYDKLKDLL